MSNLKNNNAVLEALIEQANALPIAITVDATLTQEGSAADAKATGDAINNIPQVDWNQNDDSAKDHIKNRPFYVADEKLETELGRFTRNFTQLTSGNLYTLDNYTITYITYFTIDFSKEYIVIYDGERYQLKPENHNNRYVLGNGALMSLAEDNGLPFAVFTYGEGSNVVNASVSTSGSHSFEVYRLDEDVHQIDKKYLPVADVAISGSYYDLKNRPTDPWSAAYSAVENHDVSTEAHEDIRKEIISVKDSFANGLTLVDQVTGLIYVLAMRDGNLTTMPGVKGIEIITPPDKTEYMDGDEFDPTGMVIEAINPDGSRTVVTDYTYSPVALVEGDVVTINYLNASVTAPITVDWFDAEQALIDFNFYQDGFYDENDNYIYQYYITGWKGTYNGEPSTEIIVPNNSHIAW